MRCALLWIGLWCGTLSAQTPYDNWFFGYGGGITFAGGSPTYLAGSPFMAAEGSTAISDAAGHLLFSTDGMVLYDRTGSPMPNGTALDGYSSTAQSALIVPFVDDPQRYYVFTAPSQLANGGGTYAGLSYSVVDMALNGGLGDVETLNVHLADQTTEHLTAARHANGRDAWMVTHGWDSDEYHAYLITCTGVQGPVDSHAGGVIGQDPGGSYFAAIGCMDISDQGDRLALTYTDFVDVSGTDYLDILSFDNATGVVGAGTRVVHPATAANDYRGYGAAFSPDGTKVYWSEYGLLGGMGYGGLLQYDLTSADIPASEQVIATTNNAFGTLQLGPDGKLYCARLNGTSYISRIEVPDAAGAACGFTEMGVSIAPSQSTWGLSNNWDTFPEVVPLEPLALNDTTICNGASFVADATYEWPFGTPTYSWSTGATTPAITITDEGHYSVEVTLDCDVLTAEFGVTFGGFNAELGDDRLLCLGDSLVLEVPSPAGQVFWSTGDTTRTTTVRDEGPVWLSLWDGEGCVTRDTVFVDVTDCTCPVYVPNAFTPNTDDINDAFMARGNCDFKQYKLTVFDRWGHELFASDDPLHAWTGEGVPTGVYTWTLDYAWNDGERQRNAERKGHIALIR